MMNKYLWLIAVLLFVPTLYAQSLNVEIEIPAIKANPYHKPYIAVWVETQKRKGVHTLAFWKEQPDWFKDLRQWWRKIGRSKSPDYDAVTGATRKPGKYLLNWDGTLVSGKALAAGNYVLHIESVREQGGREYLRQKFSFGKGQRQSFTLQGKTELGKINITIK